MAQAKLCPVCKGTGKVTKTTAGTAGGTFEVDCHGCNGRGWVEVAEDTYPYYPYPYTIEPWYPYPYYTTTPIRVFRWED